MKTIIERAKEWGEHIVETTPYDVVNGKACVFVEDRNIADVAEESYIAGAKEQRAIDDEDIKKLNSIMEHSVTPDYWTRLEHQYAGMAMQGLCANTKFMQDHEGDFQCNEDMIAVYAKDIAHALVEKYKKEE